MSFSHNSGAREKPPGRAHLEPIVTARIVNREGGCWLRMRRKLNALRRGSGPRPRPAGVTRGEVVEPVGCRLIRMEACVLCGARKTGGFDLAPGCPMMALRSMSKPNVRKE